MVGRRDARRGRADVAGGGRAVGARPGPAGARRRRRARSHLGRTAGRSEVVELCDRACAATGGAFDAGHLPLPDGGHGFDPSGLVKGWAVERAARQLDGLDAHDHIINAGGDVLTYTAPDRAPWRVGIEDPTRDGHLLEVLSLGGGAVATSGTARRGRHIVDPATGRAASALISATVVGPRLLWADVYATAAIARGPDALGWLDRLPDYEALLVDADGGRHTTARWPGWTFVGAPVGTSSRDDR
jgi:FAD:protein FMN transferase